MTATTELELKSFVLLRLGELRYAVVADATIELVHLSRVFRFPHKTPEIEGVILRRGRVVPVCDVAEVLLGKRTAARRYYLIATRRYGSQTEWVALPVARECELINAEQTALTAASESDEPHVAGWLSHEGEIIEVLNLGALTPGPDELPPQRRATQQLQTQPAGQDEPEVRP